MDRLKTKKLAMEWPSLYSFRSLPLGILIGVASVLIVSLAPSCFLLLSTPDLSVLPFKISLPLPSGASLPFLSSSARPQQDKQQKQEQGLDQKYEHQQAQNQEQENDDVASTKITGTIDNNSEYLPFFCDTTHAYTTTVISTEPLILYLTNFLTDAEIESVLRLGTSRFRRSNVQIAGKVYQSETRTSNSAVLPRSYEGSLHLPVPEDNEHDLEAVECILARARNFMGPEFYDDGRAGIEENMEGGENRQADDGMGLPQLVRYGPGEKFDVHYDWFADPQKVTWKTNNNKKYWNRRISFFAILEDDCEEGETWFPKVEARRSMPPPFISTLSGNAGSSLRNESYYGKDRKNENANEGKEEAKEDRKKEKPLWRRHPDGGMAFRPIRGNALFWVNMHANDTGDIRTAHSGMPLKSGRKTAMNIWPWKFLEGNEEEMERIRKEVRERGEANEAKTQQAKIQQNETQQSQAKDNIQVQSVQIQQQVQQAQKITQQQAQQTQQIIDDVSDQAHEQAHEQAKIISPKKGKKHTQEQTEEETSKYAEKDV